MSVQVPRAVIRLARVAVTAAAFVVVASSSARAADAAAALIYPADGATGIDGSLPARWTAVDGAQAYYLYVGTTPGAKDIVNTGELSATTYPLAMLPSSRLLYARMWTKVAGAWRWADTTFTTAGTTRSATSTLTLPADGAAGVDVAAAFRWTVVPDVQAYYL